MHRYREVAQRLREARRQAGLTQADVARDFQISRQAVSLWENGRVMPCLLDLRELCVLYEVSSDYLLFGVQTIPVAAGSSPVMREIFKVRA